MKILLPWEELGRDCFVRFIYPKNNSLRFSKYKCSVFFNGIDWRYSLIDLISNYSVRIGNAETKESAQNIIDKMLSRDNYRLLDEKMLVLL